jgi:hypothetical protein
MRRLLLFTVFLLIFQHSAQAQFGPFGFGGPFFGPANAPYVSPTMLVQDRRPMTQNVGGPVTTAPANPNAYWNYTRDSSQSFAFTPRNDIRRGVRGIDSASTRRVSTPNSRNEKSGVKPADHFLGFFGQNGQLVWPADAPLEGELSGKRAAVDSAMAELRTQAQSKTNFKVSSIVQSRNTLLDYGRPSLAILRENQPSRADSFHAWMLDLYNTLGQMSEQLR